MPIDGYLRINSEHQPKCNVGITTFVRLLGQLSDPSSKTDAYKRMLGQLSMVSMLTFVALRS